MATSRALALGLLADCSTKITYQQESAEAPHTAEVLGLSETERGELPDLARGEGLWRIGQRAFVLRHLVTDADSVKALVARALPAPALEPDSGLRNLPPALDTAVRGADVGISVMGSNNQDCLLGARVAGKVLAGRPSRTQLQAGELTCDPQTALQLPSIRPPH